LSRLERLGLALGLASGLAGWLLLVAT